jgi:hypothetical protein
VTDCYAILTVPMRLKLILLTSLIAFLIGVLASIVLLIVSGLATIDYVRDAPAYRSRDWIQLAAYLPPIVTALLGGVFVYRHTAIKRKLQGIITVALVTLYCVAFLLVLRFV